MSSNPIGPTRAASSRRRRSGGFSRSSGRLYRLQPALVTTVVSLVVLTAVAVAASAAFLFTLRELANVSMRFDDFVRELSLFNRRAKRRKSKND